MKALQFATLLLLTVGAAACSDAATPTEGWAIVKVEIVDGPPLTAICIGSVCRDFDPIDDVRVGEYSAYTTTDSTIEVRREGEEVGDGATMSGSAVGGCILVRMTADAVEFVGGCEAPPPES